MLTDREKQIHRERERVSDRQRQRERVSNRHTERVSDRHLPDVLSLTFHVTPLEFLKQMT